MLTFFCPGCWKDFREDLAQCPHCGLDIHEFLKTTDFVDKLILALEHPEEETAIRAAWILGKLRDPRAVEPLRHLLAETGDVYLAGEAAAALGKIGTAEARSALRAFVNHPAQMVREEAQRILDRMALKEREESCGE
jgi:HEAT repeat protein